MYNKIPKNWEKVKLKKYIEIVRGVNYKSNEVYDYKNDNTTGILRANNISNNGMFNFEKIIYVDNKNIKNEQMIKNGDIVIAMSSGSKNLVGKAAQAKQNLNFAFGAFCSVVRPKNINSDFLGFYFLTDYYRNKISELSTGININNLRKDYIENLDIMVPLDPKEQEKIVQVLDPMSNIIRLREKCISHAQDLIPALFQEMFGDPINNNKNYSCESLKKLCSKIGSGATPRGGKESYLKEGISFVRSMNVHDGIFQYKDLAFINDEQAKLLDNVELQESDVLINITGASVARTCIVPKEILPARVNQHVSILRCTGRLNPYFLNVLLYFQTTKQKLLDLANSKGATREAITKQQLELFKIILPPIEQQEFFAEKVQEIEAYIKTQQAELENAKQMFQSLLHHAFTGELTRHKFGGDANG